MDRLTGRDNEDDQSTVIERVEQFSGPSVSTSLVAEGPCSEKKRILIGVGSRQREKKSRVDRSSLRELQIASWSALTVYQNGKCHAVDAMRQHASSVPMVSDSFLVVPRSGGFGSDDIFALFFFLSTAHAMTELLLFGIAESFFETVSRRSKLEHV